MASRPTRPPIQRWRRSTPPRSGRRSIRSSRMFSTSTRRAITPSSAPQAERLARAFWPGPLTLVLPAAPNCRISLLARAGLDTVALRSPVRRNREGAHQSRGQAARGALRQSVGAREPDDGRPCPRRPRRQGRLDSRRRPVPLWSRIDNCRSSRRSASLAASRSDHQGGDRSRARIIDRCARRIANGAQRAGATGVALRSQGRPSPRRRRCQARTRRRSISAGCCPPAARARGSIFRRRETSSRRRRICSPICASSTNGGPARIAVAPIPAHGLGAAINDRLRRAAAPRPG